MSTQSSMRRVGPPTISPDEIGKRIADISFPTPFPSYLEYNPPVHGTWNIVHTGMLVPDAHIIYVCAAGCLRGVVLTAAEMGEMSRFSSISVREPDIVNGRMDDLIIDGVCSVIDGLAARPRAVLIYTSCVHNFVGTDLRYIYGKLRERYPDIDFSDGYMTPIMKKTVPPDTRTWQTIYSLLKKNDHNSKGVNIIGCDLKIDEDTQIFKIAKAAKVDLLEITKCNTYEEFQKMGSSYANIYMLPVAARAAGYLEKHHGQKSLYMPVCYSYKEINLELDMLCRELGVDMPFDEASLIEECEKEAKKTADLLGDSPVSVDGVCSPRPLGLARYLIEHGMNVISLFVDGLNAEEEDDFKWLFENRPDIMVYPTIDPKMRVFDRKRGENVLAIGQKAAYFNSTKHFVNMIEGGGLHGYSGIIRLMELIRDAYENEKDTKDIVPRKGLTCMSVI